MVLFTTVNKLPFLDPSVLARPGDLTPDDVADMHRVDGVIDSDDVFDIPAAADGAASDEGARDTHACASAPDDGCCPRVNCHEDTCDDDAVVNLVRVSSHVECLVSQCLVSQARTRSSITAWPLRPFFFYATCRGVPAAGTPQGPNAHRPKCAPGC